MQSFFVLFDFIFSFALNWKYGLKNELKDLPTSNYIKWKILKKAIKYKSNYRMK
jgi:hypothetical protein